MTGNSLGRSSSLEPVHQMSTPPYSVRYLCAARTLFSSGGSPKGKKTYVYRPRAHALIDVHWMLIRAWVPFPPPPSESTSLKVKVSRTLSFGVRPKLKDVLWDGTRLWISAYRPSTPPAAWVPVAVTARAAASPEAMNAAANVGPPSKTFISPSRARGGTKR